MSVTSNTQIMPPGLPIVHNHNSCNLLLHTYCRNSTERLLFFLSNTRYYILFLSIDDHIFFSSVCIINKIGMLLLYHRELPCAFRDAVAPDNFGCGARTCCLRRRVLYPHPDAVHGRRKRQRFHIAGATFRRARAPHDTNNNNNTTT